MSDSQNTANSLTVLIAGALAPAHWLDNPELQAMINESPLARLIAQYKISKNAQPSWLDAFKNELALAPVPRNLPHETWLAFNQKLPSYGHLAARTVLHDWPEFSQRVTKPSQTEPATSWWRVDPVYCRLATDHIVLGNAHPDDVSHAEAQLLGAALNDYCAQMGYELHVAHPNRWYLRWNIPSTGQHLSTASVMAAQGRSIQLYLPQNIQDDAAIDYARAWRRLVGEAEVAWFNHPVNLNRQDQGRLPINSLWLVGQCAISDQAKSDNNVIEITSPVEHLINDGAFEWASAVAAISEQQLQPIYDHLADNKPCTLVLTSDQEMVQYSLEPLSRLASLKKRLGLNTPSQTWPHWFRQSVTHSASA